MVRRRIAPAPLDAIAQQLDALSHEELLEVQAMLEALLATKAEPPNIQAETADPEGYRGPKGGKGHIEIKLIPDTKRGKTYGPYRYLRFWHEGKLKTRYLGKAES